MVTIATVRDSARLALQQGVIAVRGPASAEVVQAANADQAQALSTATSAATSTVDVSTPSSQVTGTLWTLSDRSVHLQRLIAGRYARGRGEVTVSRQIQQGLGVLLGGEVTVREGATRDISRVVGITVNPADASDRALTSVGRVNPQSADFWILSAQLLNDRKVNQYIESGTLPASFNQAAIARALRSPPSSIASLRFAPLVAAILLLIAQMVVVWAFAPIARRDVRGLVAAGAASRDAWRIIGTVCVACSCAGLSAGALMAAGVVSWLRTPISTAFGQDWVEIDLSWEWLLLLVVSDALVLVSARPLGRALARRAAAIPAGSEPVAGSTRDFARSRRTLRFAIAALSLIIGVGIVVMPYVAPSHRPGGELLIAGVVLSGLGLRPFAAIAVAPLLGNASRRLVRVVLIQRSATFACAFAVAAICGTYLAIVHEDDQSVPSSSNAQVEQPPGSLLMYGVPDRSVERILRAYSAAGGGSAETFKLPSSRLGDVRVTRPTGCPAGTGSSSASCFAGVPVSVVAFSTSLTSNEIRVEPGVIEDGRTEVVIFSSEGIQQPKARTYAASADDSLGGNMPGMVVARAGEVARTFKLRPSGLSEVALFDFDSLDQRHAATLRRVISRVAPTAQVSGTAELTESLASATRLEHGITAVAAGLSAMILLIGGVGVALGNYAVRLTFATLGASIQYRLRIWFVTVLPDIVTLVAISALVPFAIRGLYGGSISTVGIVWAMPLVAAAIATLASTAIFAVRAKAPPT